MTDPERRWFHPRRSDLAFLLGAVVFMVNGLTRQHADETMVYASLALMGFSIAGRLDDRRK